ncbi:uncharacterized protein HKW66_Vig0184500 [Vigna angularis]|uniref:PB1-like domain-containing protein n=1 Tax=Phaseolus angularis TaxID=3914 RepID=A0A8T0KTX5_PHAAN|nr:uncharacterized protein HKW66_Vig0184500 [Vigna angularis]
MEGDIEVVIHHRGNLVNEGCLKYEGENDTMHFDPDLWSYFVVVSAVKSLGYDGFKDLWYSVGCGPVLDGKLEALCDDVGVMHMINLARLNGQVHLYVVHTVSEPDVIQMIEYNVHEEGQEVALEMHEGGECAMLDERTEEDDGLCLKQSLEDGGVTKQLDEGVGGHVGEGDRIEVDVEGEGIQDDEGHDERTKPNNVQETIEVDVEGEGIQDDEAHDERTEPNNVQETIEVDVEGEEIQDDEMRLMMRGQNQIMFRRQ